MAPCCFCSGKDAAQDQTLSRHCSKPPQEERSVPDMFSCGVYPELKGHAAEDQTIEKRKERNIQGAEQHSIHQRKGHKENASAKDEPGLICVPDGCNAVHQRVALYLVMSERE